MVKISIRANCQIKTPLLTAAAANPAPSSSTKLRQQQRKVNTTQAPCPIPWQSEHCGSRRLGFFDHTGFCWRAYTFERRPTQSHASSAWLSVSPTICLCDGTMQRRNTSNAPSRTCSLIEMPSCRGIELAPRRRVAWVDIRPPRRLSVRSVRLLTSGLVKHGSAASCEPSPQLMWLCSFVDGLQPPQQQHQGAIEQILTATKHGLVCHLCLLRQNQ